VKKVAFVEHDVAQDKQAAKQMIERTKQFAVPVLIVDDKDIVIGFNVARLDELLFPKDKKAPS
jgi:glutaredoxin